MMDAKQEIKHSRKIIDQINQGIKSGLTLSECLKSYPRVFSSLLLQWSRWERRAAILLILLKWRASRWVPPTLCRKKVRGALIYPCVIITIMVIIGVVMLIYVVPTLTATFKEFNLKLPLMTRIVIALSDFLSQHVLLSIGMVGFCFAFFYMFGQSKVGSKMFDYCVIRIPMIGYLIKETNALGCRERSLLF